MTWLMPVYLVYISLGGHINEDDPNKSLLSTLSSFDDSNLKTIPCVYLTYLDKNDWHRIYIFLNIFHHLLNEYFPINL